MKLFCDLSSFKWMFGLYSIATVEYSEGEYKFKESDQENTTGNCKSTRLSSLVPQRMHISQFVHETPKKFMLFDSLWFSTCTS